MRPRSPSAGGRPAGRHAELAALVQAAEEARTGTARRVVVRGAAGTGKTSLLRALRRDPRLRGATVLDTVCEERHSQEEHGALRRLLPDAERLPSGGSGTWQAVADAIGRGPGVLVVDDAQWCDERSLRRLERLPREAEGLPLLIVLAWGAHGTGSARAALGTLVRQPGTRLVTLEALREAAVGEVVGRTFGTPPDPAFVRRCAALTGGNPLLLRHLLVRLRRRGTPPAGDAVGHADEGWHEARTAVVRAHLGRLPEERRRVLRAAAVLGWTGTPPPAAAADGHPATPERVGALAGVSAWQASEILGGYGDVPPIGEPESLRAIVLATTPPEELTDLRTRAARLLNDEGCPAHDVAAHLLFLPRLTEAWMLGVLRDAAEQARWSGAPAEAVPCLRLLLAHEREEHGRVRTGLELAAALVTTDPSAALDVLERLLHETADARLHALAAVQFGTTAVATGNPSAAFDVLSHARRTLGEASASDTGPADRELGRRAEAALLFAALHDRPASEALGTRVRDAAARAPDGAAGLLPRALLGAVEGTSARTVADLADRAVRAGETEVPDWMRVQAALVCYLADEPGMTLEMLGRALADSAGCVPRWALLAARSTVRHRLGDIPAATADARAALEGMRHPGQRTCSASPLAAWARVQLERFGPDAAKPVLDQVTERHLQYSVLDEPYYLTVRAQERLHRGDLEGALAHARACGRWLDDAGLTNPAWGPWRSLAVTALTGLGRTGEAAELADAGLEPARRWGTRHAVGLALLTAGIAATGDRRVALLEQAVHELSRTQARLDRARAHMLLGSALARRGDAEGAYRRLWDAYETARHCGSSALTAKTLGVLATAGGGARRTAGALARLSPTEWQVAGSAARGASNREIAETLFLGRRTVEMHLTSVYRKLGLAGRAGLPGALALRTVRPGPSTARPASPPASSPASPSSPSSLSVYRSPYQATT
ncbi:AAA family ATPase [Streptomyces monomycini]|uniref:AAA family ATPase n=1 Tax=Streptomyces monomycini TaxID=371720 RepID=UPI0004AA3A56|nr:LuxR family transcriptional regulator [Streptomyces monomycini]